ncbi:hypothetical protein LWI29_012180 [Acer saccharum]|uniref:Polymerase nucleotidyl transferase domain-containing protein n=1 Tax=Acer saccharum TaxID=4024 RepID=A0AA39SDC2_ACESA|nr:hypothetical protein LWI29_012180 [Acer saccharum]
MESLWRFLRFLRAVYLLRIAINNGGILLVSFPKYPYLKLKTSAFVVMEDLQETSTPSSLVSSLSSLSPHNPLLPIDPDLWLMAEERTQEILCTIQPALVSEKKRKEVIEYIQRLINGYFGIEVFPFGSVPLKTYLPDGDIDLTALSPHNLEEDLATNLCNILEGEGQDTEFEVKDVQHVHAQVKIVKCNVKDIPVDISFNQMAGLAALCFLEQVDQLIGKGHLFKRSVILIKAWCYYESRILGAHYGLISTYALEMLVLCIINLFHSSLCGPLEVLYKFVDYYSKFDWDNYCISINGPFPITSLQEIVAGTLENDGDELLLSREFVRKCRETYLVPIKAPETTGQKFPIKHINILDPLKDSNNLGRSVSKGNFHRIRCALAYGAQRLKNILMLPGESIGIELENFFTNTLERNGKGQRPDIQVPVPAFGTGRSVVSDLSGDYDSYYNSLLYGQNYHDYILPVSGQFSTPSPPSQICNRTGWDTLRQFVRCKRSSFYRWGAEVFDPRFSVYHPYVSQLPAATFNLDEVEKSRGTGTYIPDITHYSYRNARASSARNPESIPRIPFRKSLKKIDQAEDLPGMENGGDKCCLNLSLEEFPLLPVTKNPATSETVCQFDQSVVDSIQGKDCAPPLAGIRFGTLEYSLPPSGLPSTSVITEKQKQSESDGEASIIKPYHLIDANDFPPLPS